MNSTEILLYKKKKLKSSESLIMNFKFNIQFMKNLGRLDKHFWRFRVYYTGGQALLGNQFVRGFSSAKATSIFSQFLLIFSLGTHRYSQAYVSSLALLALQRQLQVQAMVYMAHLLSQAGPYKSDTACIHTIV